MSKTVTLTQTQSPPHSSDEVENSPESPLEQSKLLNRVASYSLVNRLVETTRGLYSRAKDAHQIVKNGLQSAEHTLQWANSQPQVLRAERVLLNYVDDFGCRQLDRLDSGVVKAQEIYHTDYVSAVKTKSSDLIHAGKDLVDTKVIQPGRETVEDLKTKSWSEILQPVTQRIAPVASSVSQKTLSIVQTGANAAYSKSLGVVERVLPEGAATSGELTLSYQRQDVSNFSTRVRQDASVVQVRLQRKLLEQLRNLNIRVRTPERIEQLQRNSVNLLQYASNYLNNVKETATEKLAPVTERLPAPPAFVSRAVESTRTRLEALRSVVWQRSQNLFLRTSHAALSYLPPSLLATASTAKHNVIEFIYDVPDYAARKSQDVEASQSSPLRSDVEDENDLQTKPEEIQQPVPVYTRPQYEVIASRLEAEALQLEDEASRLEEEVDEEEKLNDNKQDDDAETDQE